MDKVYIVFWTQGGNTGEMAVAVAEGVKEAGKEPLLLSPMEANIEELKHVPAFAMGCPAMGAEVLEETEMEPFVEDAEGFVSGKKLGLFGSYGWGDGQWMRDWEKRMKDAGAAIIGNKGIIAMDAPGDTEKQMCKELGRKLAEM